MRVIDKRSLLACISSSYSVTIFIRYVNFPTHLSTQFNNIISLNYSFGFEVRGRCFILAIFSPLISAKCILGALSYLHLIGLKWLSIRYAHLLYIFIRNLGSFLPGLSTLQANL